MPGSGWQFAPDVAEVLRHADRTIRHLAPREHRKLYNLWRVTMGIIAPVDSFYVAFFRDEKYLVVPYVYDEREYDSPGFQMYGPAGLSAWIKKHAKPYMYAMDNGRLLNMGHSFGDEERLSRDAVAIPLLGPSPDGPTVIGIASMQTYRPEAYDDNHARAFQWLARSVVTALAREREDLANEDMLSADDDDPLESPRSVPEIIDEFSYKLDRLHDKIESILQSTPSSQRATRIELSELRDMCERAKTETMELLLAPSEDSRSLLARSTPREQEVADLMADGLTNDEIAARLVVSKLTVKTHVTRVLKKFGVRQRAAVAARLRPFGQ